MFTDRFGREFVVGARVVYAVRAGNVGVLMDGTITKIVPCKDYRWVNGQRQLVDWFKLQIEAQQKWGAKKMFKRTLHKVENAVVVP